MISKTIQGLINDTTSLKELDDLLGLLKTHKPSPASNPSSSDFENYLKLFLKKQHVISLLHLPQSQQALAPLTEIDDVETLPGILSDLKQRLWIYNQFKRDVKQFKKETKMTDLNWDTLALNFQDERLFVTSLLSQIKQVEEVMDCTLELFRDEQEEQNRSEVEAGLIQRMDRAEQLRNEIDSYEGHQIENEFSALVKDLQDFCHFAPLNPRFTDGLSQMIANQVRQEVLTHNISQARSVFGHLQEQYRTQITPMSQMILIRTREKQNQITKFMKNEQAYYELQRLQRLESELFGPGQLFNPIQDSQNLSLDNEARARALAKVMSEGVPTRTQLAENVRNFFEGPVNLDLMALGVAKNIASGEQADSVIQKFSHVVQHSQALAQVL